MLREFVAIKGLSIICSACTLSTKTEVEGYFYSSRVRFERFSIMFPLLKVNKKSVTIYLFHSSKCNSPHEADQSLIKKFYDIQLLSSIFTIESVYLVVPGSSDKPEDERFKIFEITGRVNFYIENRINPILAKAKSIAMTQKMPEIRYGSHCRLGARDQCPFASQCLELGENGNLLSYKGLGKSVVGPVWERDIRKIAELPYSIQLSKKAQTIVQVAHSQKPNINSLAISEWLVQNDLNMASIERPLIFLDFEAFRFDFPLQPGWGQDWHLFQYSVHVLDNGSSLKELRPYLHDLEDNPRIVFCQNLIATLRPYLDKGGKVVVYNQSFEKSRLRECVTLMPDLRANLEQIIDRMVDLMVPFQKLWYYSPEQRGGYTLKIVYPLMLRILGLDYSAQIKDYNSLKIKNGIEAVLAYQKYAASSLKLKANPSIRGYDSKKQSLSRYLLEYCALDTLSMYFVLKGLHTIIQGGETLEKIGQCTENVD